ncbi:hypothetical protein ROR02_15560 [Pararhodospirillum oryzae]|uniref:Uncharacterized protein n=1 Tax=Pararhodospirillum oryzae TaxID=478448 RepID=A0A512H7I7_9PROT|nr:hypothetical protein ROR02_15560 [Pararhodospirillum oryzae]
MDICKRYTRKVSVKNANGTSDLKCKCGSWIAHWEKYSEEEAVFCCVEGCLEEAEHGAHVVISKTGLNDPEKHFYIVPMCHKHNIQRGKEFVVNAETAFVWANKAKTCDR